jgi:hypothetical protein
VSKPNRFLLSGIRADAVAVISRIVCLISSRLISAFGVVSATPLLSCAHGNGSPDILFTRALLPFLFERAKTSLLLSFKVMSECRRVNQSLVDRVTRQPAQSDGEETGVPDRLRPAFPWQIEIPLERVSHASKKISYFQGRSIQAKNLPSQFLECALVKQLRRNTYMSNLSSDPLRAFRLSAKS